VADGVAAAVAYLNNGSYGQIVSDLNQAAGLSGSDVASELEVSSGHEYSTIPDSWAPRRHAADLAGPGRHHGIGRGAPARNESGTG
jgi:hypothetical protein